ncbi:MAG: TadE/TadG family type IV pilus assembly protein [Pseudomonadota bacterium]
MRNFLKFLPRGPKATSGSASRGSYRAKSQSGLAAVEFALIAPVMIFAFFAAIEGASAFAAGRRASNAAHMLADIVAQEMEIEAAALNDLFVGVSSVVNPTSNALPSGSTVTFTAVSLEVDPDTNKIVVGWSRDSAGAEPYAVGTEYTKVSATIVDPNASLVVAEIDYNYVPPLTKTLLPFVNFQFQAVRRPRRASAVRFCASPGNCI